MACTMRFMAKIESKSFAATIRARSAVLERRREAAADHVSQHVEDHDVGVLEQVVLLEELHRLADDVAAAAVPAGRAAGLDCNIHAVCSHRRTRVLDPQLLGVEFDVSSTSITVGIKNSAEREVLSGLGVAPILMTRLPSLEEGGGSVFDEGRRFPDAALGP